ncbi:maltase-glucoamylase, intestinal protein [Thalictrum thalictroides]|uniref:Maltase-glucoamylase, intestinal protein n=1 Tax=Thalictrum thalictroides TaxID=46969 RepID=A0A7J6X5S5_THATH|nr:maltase-glucoamylase, intestinal protein [Thalictrum thalictroides]
MVGSCRQSPTNEGFEEVKLLEEPYKEFPDVIEPMRDDIQSTTDLDFQLIVPPLPEENKTITSEPVSDVESQSLLKLDFTDAFTTDEMPKDDEWMVKVVCGHHNHQLGRHLQGSSVVRKLTPEEKEIVKLILKTGVKPPKDILKALKERHHRNESTNLSSMAEEEEVVNAFKITPPQQCSSSFLEVNCKSSGKVRRFSVGTEASFALELINQKLVSGDPSASYIEAFKDGEEPISFGPNSLLIDYGDGWKLQTVTNEGFEKQNGMDLPYEDFSNIIEPRKEIVEFATDYDLEDPLQEVEEPMRDDVQSATDLDFHLIVPPLPEENKTITSEPVSDVESQSLLTLDFTDAFKTDEVFNSRDELIKWTRDVGRSVGVVVIIKKSEFGVSGRTSRLFFACERFGQRRENKKYTSTRKRTSKRCDCPFLLRGIKMPKDDEWMVKVVCGHHNHQLGRHLQGSSVAGKLTPEEKELVKHMLKTGVKPKDILKALKERDHRNESTVRTIYNAQAKLRLEEMSAISQCNSS